MINKLACMTLEGVLHVWDCRQLDVRSREGSRHSPHNRELLMVGGLSLYTTRTTESPPIHDTNMIALNVTVFKIQNQ